MTSVYGYYYEHTVRTPWLALPEPEAPPSCSGACRNVKRFLKAVIMC
jgi:hypothetical protein